MPCSVTRLGDILKFLVTNYPPTVAQMYGKLWVILKNFSRYFRATFGKCGQLLILTSGHTDAMGPLLILIPEKRLLSKGLKLRKKTFFIEMFHSWAKVFSTV